MFEKDDWNDLIKTYHAYNLTSSYLCIALIPDAASAPQVDPDLVPEW